MRKLGLTGGIASGKSAVAALLREMGFHVLDADSIAHKLIEPGQPAHEEVLSKFGSELAAPDGRIERGKLAAIVFADPAKLAQLNKILHPLVEDAIFRQFDEWQKSGVREPVFVEAALLIEAGLAGKLEGVIVAWCTPEQQIERLLARGMSESEARRRIEAQLPVAEKLLRASHTIDCSGTLEHTRAQVHSLAAKLRTPA